MQRAYPAGFGQGSQGYEAERGTHEWDEPSVGRPTRMGRPSREPSQKHLSLTQAMVSKTEKGGNAALLVLAPLLNDVVDCYCC